MISKHHHRAITRLAALALGVAAMSGTIGSARAGELVAGVTAALTGPIAGTYAPVVEALRAWADHVNARGGPNKIRLIVLDDSGQASKAAANAKRLVTQENVTLLINSSLSSTYAPMLGVAKRGKVPVWFAGSVCPPDTYPPKPDPALFCSTSFGASYDSRMALGFIKQNASGPVKLGFSAMSIPLSRNEVGYAATEAKKMGMGTTEQQIIPPPTADYTPFATKIKDQGANWVYSWAPWVTQIRTLDALRKLGWSGDYIAYAHINAEDELERVKDGKFYVFGANAMFRDNLPVHAELRAVAQRAKLKYPITQLTEGFISGMILEAIAAKAGAKPTRASVLAAMGKLDVDLKGLRGGPIQWTASNHFRARQSYRVYRFDPAKGAIERVQDWTAFDVK
ncbi:MAG: ABC transporter substrate-binding protein [Burkholderiaceae bacterium]|nr:ABC transporter substrate-binding protein [Burkholderiaceae bacterium]